MKKNFKLDEQEPDQVRFKLPSIGEHAFQVVEANDDKNLSNLVVVKLEVINSEEAGRSIQMRINLDENWKGFFTTRLFLKAIGEPYKGDFDVDTDMWIGKTFVASIVHNKGNNGKTYANIDKYNFDVKVDKIEQTANQPTEIDWKE